MKTTEEKEIFEGRWYAHPRIRNAIVSGALAGSAFTLVYFKMLPLLLGIVLYFAAILFGGYHWVREGLEELFEEKKIGIEILMMTATIGSILLGFWDEAAFLVFLYGAAEGIEEYTHARTRLSIRELLDLAPKKASVLREGEEVTVAAEELKVGDVFIVRPGEAIPTDGIIVEGRSSVNESPVTGEPIPVEKREEMKVFAGTINQEGVLEVRASATFEDNTISKMIKLVEEAQEQKGRAQIFIERFGARYSPIVLLSALLLTVFPLIFCGDLSEWTTRAIVLLVAASPCALVISTPVAIAAGIGRAGRRGVLIKGGIHLEDLGKIKAVAFDKTSTLTRGEAVVKDVVSLNGDEEKALCLCYSIERFSEHPLAQAIVEKAKQCDIKPLDITNFESLTGSGVRAKIGDREFYAGRPELFQELGMKIKGNSVIEKLRNKGDTVIAVGTSESIECAIAIGDEVRPQAKAVVDELRSMGVKTIMLTGDNEIVAETIAEKLGLDEFRANLKPEDKIEAIKEIEQRYGVVAMVGDGINDAPALAQATVGIAMGTAGTDAAIKAADAALIGDDLTQVPFAINLGKKTREISRQNIAFSLFVLAVLIPAALIGFVDVALAVFFHEASELLAVANGLRVGRK